MSHTWQERAEYMREERDTQAELVKWLQEQVRYLRGELAVIATAKDCNYRLRAGEALDELRARTEEANQRFLNP